MGKRKTPYQRIMEKLNFTPQVMAKKLGLNQTTVYRWGYPRPKGLGGLIPQEYHRKIKTLAQRRKVKLTAEDFVGV